MDLPNACLGQDNNDGVRQMIEALPAGTREYDAAGLEAEDLEELLQRDSLFTHAIEHSAGDGKQHLDRYVVFKNVVPHTMRDFSNQRHIGRTKDQNPSNNLIIVNMPSREHEKAIHYFGQLLEESLNEMRPKLSLKLEASGAADVQGTTRCKAPDASYLPRSLPANRSAKWPSLVLEVGYSESASKLRNDASWWLAESQGDVRVVMTLKVLRNYRMHFEMWQFRDGAARPRPIMTQEATVTKSASGYSASAGMVIRFEDLFLRAPAGNGERDIVFDHDDLEGLAQLALEV